MFLTRLKSSIVIVIVVFGLCFIGGYPLFGALVLVSMQGMFELYRACKIEKTCFAVISYFMALAIYTLYLFNLTDYMVLLLILNVLLFMTAFVIGFPKYSFRDLTIAFFGVFYVAVMLAYLYQIRSLENGIFWIWLVFVGSWGSDTGAYCFGMLLGKHKIVPKLSPKKTVEGCIGGVVSSAAFGLLFALLFGERVGVHNPYLAFALIGAAGSVIAQVGDLAASAVKRQCEIKDYGKTIPGHGGFLDRFDSVIYVAPLCYFLIQLFIG